VLDSALCRRIVLAAIDIDGTLTRARDDVRLVPESIEVVDLLESNGVMASLMTGNSLPVAAGLSKYLGSRGPVIAENGCVVFHEDRIYHVCSGRPPLSLVEEIKGLGFRESWQNAFRFHEYALIPPGGYEGLVERAIEMARSRGYNAIWTGYALHIQPPGGGKLKGLSAALELVGASLEDVIAFGDGDNDVEVLSAVPFSASPGDASPRAKSSATYVASLPGARGVLEAVRAFIECRSRPTL